MLNKLRLGEPKILCEFSNSKTKYHFKATFYKYIFLTILITRFCNKFILLWFLYSSNNRELFNLKLHIYFVVHIVITRWIWSFSKKKLTSGITHITRCIPSKTWMVILNAISFVYRRKLVFAACGIELPLTKK